MSQNRDTGRIISFIGGALSLGYGIFSLIKIIGVIREFGIAISNDPFAIIYIVLFVMGIIGGIITIIGAYQAEIIGPRKGGTIVMIGSLIAGINIISLIGAGMLRKDDIPISSSYKQPSGPAIPTKTPIKSPSNNACNKCGAKIEKNQFFCEACLQKIQNEN